MEQSVLSESSEVVYADRTCGSPAQASEGTVGYGMWGGKFTHLIFVTAVSNWVPAGIFMNLRLFNPKVDMTAPSAVALPRVA